MFALCDANSMYASCEKVFDPSVRNKPVVVLTNNDGCICAACGIAKRLGVGKKFVPYFQVKKELEAVGAVIRSSNYELYADLSQRMMDTCARFAPDINVYSIDECFYITVKKITRHKRDGQRSPVELEKPSGERLGFPFAWGSAQLPH